MTYGAVAHSLALQSLSTRDAADVAFAVVAAHVLSRGRVGEVRW